MNPGEQIKVTDNGALHFVGLDRFGREEWIACALPDYRPLRTFAGENARARAEGWLVAIDVKITETAERLRDRLFPPPPEVDRATAIKAQDPDWRPSKLEVLTYRDRRGRRRRVVI